MKWCICKSNLLSVYVRLAGLAKHKLHSTLNDTQIWTKVEQSGSCYDLKIKIPWIKKINVIYTWKQHIVNELELTTLIGKQE